MVRRILVTGGAGYIGSHACKRLHQAGYEPIVLDNLSTGHRWAVRWGPLVEGDIADKALVRSVLREHRIGAILHFAAVASVAESMVKPTKYFLNNVGGSLVLFHEAIEARVKHIILSSTCATYGIPVDNAIHEDSPQSPVSPYGESKLFVEKALRWLEQVHGATWASLRYFNGAGADPEGDLGEVHDPETHLIPLVIDAALGAGGPVNVYGTDYPTPDGTAIRDYVHVSDLADAHVAALRYLQDGGASRAFNLGSGQGSSVLEVIRAVEQIGGASVPYKRAARRPGDPARLVASARRASEILGWSPQHSTLPTIVSTAWSWHSRMADRAAAAV